ncbi:ankyrin repeat-containing protein BDA1-like [Durio zibethinus]|uniref:Ankyrin repeat-containing protein BDA1-like n=1 Tax=Durio zibethinus TaxID=66656 RepID=A0A6P6AI48_DURZI|nr:ankyrin repeat-containing protein BDA1-like [Durio zibethinus]
MDGKLREAAQSGNIDNLYELFREDPHLLEHIDEVPFFDTPLHTAAAAGQVDFAVEMMNLKPSFATKLNPDGFTPMHLALQNDRNQLLFELLKINKELIRVKGKKGVTLLHYAAEQGDADLLAKFLAACPQCIIDVTVGGQTALHIAAEKTKLEALELLARWLRRTHNKDGGFWELEVMNWKDKEGNTVLHVVASNTENQVEMIRLLLECGVRKNIINLSGLTALDILQRRRHVGNREAEDILSQAGGLNAYSISKSRPLAELLRSKVEFSERLMITVTRARLNIPSDTRNAFLVLAGLVITATYQAIFNPPGGVRQAEAGSTEVPSEAGRSIMDTNSFLWFYIPNTAAFLTTLFLTVLFLIIGPNGEVVLFPLVPIVICYVMSTLVITPTPKFTYFIWLTLAIAAASGCWLFGAHLYWLLKIKKVNRSSGEINKSVLE